MRKGFYKTIIALFISFFVLIPFFTNTEKAFAQNSTSTGSGYISDFINTASNFLPLGANWGFSLGSTVGKGAASLSGASSVSDVLSNPSLMVHSLSVAIANLALKISSWFLWIAAQIFNFTITFSLNLGNFLEKMPIVNLGWTVLRDIANLCFIFILLAIAIGTILQVDAYDVKKLLAKVILVAIVINFSLFFTKVVIDASNILTLQFYNKIVANNPNGVSEVFIGGLGLSSIYNYGEVSGTKATNSDYAIEGNIVLIGIGGSILILVTAFVFFAGAILFVVRTLVLVFVMILSPVAFLATILPQTKQYWGKWVDALLKQSFFAPIFMLFIYIVATFLTTGFVQKGNTVNFAGFLAGGSNNAGTFYTFIILIGLMLGSLMVAKQFGAYGGNIARNIAGKATFGASGWLGRQTVGRVARIAQNSDRLRNFAAKDTFAGRIFGRGLESGLKGVAGSSFDARSAGSFGKLGGGLGDASGKGGIDKAIEDRQKRMKEQYDRVTKPSPKDELARLEAEEEKEKAEALQSEALLNERAEAEDNRQRAEEVTKSLNKNLEVSKKELAAIEDMKKSAQDAFNLVKARSETERQYQENILNSDWANEEESAAAQKKLDEIKLDMEQKQQAHNAEIENIEKNRTAKETEVTETQDKFDIANDTLQKFTDTVTDKDKKLKEINSKYKKGGNAEENARNNAEVIAKVRSKAENSRDYAREKGLEGKSSEKMDSHVSNVLNKHIQIKNDIAVKTEARKEGYSSPAKLDRILASYGLTTAQMGHASKMRADNRKSDKDKVWEIFQKQAKEKTEEDKGDKEKGGSKAPPPESTPPTSSK